MSTQVEALAVRKSKNPAAQKPTPAAAAESRSESASAAMANPPAPEQRLAMICEAAYYLAEHRGFAAGHELEDWLLGEKQIDAVIGYGEPAPVVR